MLELCDYCGRLKFPEHLETLAVNGARICTLATFCKTREAEIADLHAEVALFLEDEDGFRADIEERAAELARWIEIEEEEREEAEIDWLERLFFNS